MVLQAIKYTDGKLHILDQLRLPHEEIFINIKSANDAFNAIKSMQVRGAPAIAIVAALSLAVQLSSSRPEDPANGLAAAEYIRHQLAYLVTSRPTAVNLADAAKKLSLVVDDAAGRADSTASSVNEAYTKAAVHMLAADVEDNEKIGDMGASWLDQKAKANSWAGYVNVLTHCNTGSLATAGYGTALGVIRSLHARGRLGRAYYTETRPYNQGSRLTGFELIHDQIPATLITDSMAAALLKTRKHPHSIFAIVVGADRVAANGDTANKIGTYPLAILARYHGVMFLVAAPRTTIDMSTKSGTDIIIEERNPDEVTRVKGPQIKTGETEGAAKFGENCTISIAAFGTHAWNPAFDVTPADLIDGIVTEMGVVEKSADGFFHFDTIFNNNT